MAQISISLFRFHRAFRTQPSEQIGNIVRTSDAELANIISSLPQHLQPDEPRTDATEKRDVLNPWIPWQKWDLTQTFLYYRMKINCTVQLEWLLTPHLFEGQRSICLDAIRMMLWIRRNWDQPVARRRQWALSTHIFSAGVTLTLEAKYRTTDIAQDWILDSKRCVELLQEVQSQNEVAKEGAAILQDLIKDVTAENV
ncbi:hypothetical protein BP6252_08909 [Coleophoma cylindrospora]|uniref:Uncharacterized protein n=1 Tax=Coleophoma cylindrospora TaxID=1849047 RepID=A0A3D8R0C9_9HELO|nr:hypothetical protein BP6252_08909 [Coleophoma cylindrospora]